MEGAEGILRRVCQRSFGYRLDLAETGWTLLVECATDDGWQSYVLPVDPAELSGSLRDARLRERLTGTWASHLSALPAIAPRGQPRGRAPHRCAPGRQAPSERVPS